MKKDIPKMSTIIYFDSNNRKKYEPNGENTSLTVISLSDLEEMGQLSDDKILEQCTKSKEDDIAVLLYTSGNQFSI